MREMSRREMKKERSNLVGKWKVGLSNWGEFNSSVCGGLSRKEVCGKHGVVKKKEATKD